MNFVRNARGGFQELGHENKKSRSYYTPPILCLQVPRRYVDALIKIERHVHEIAKIEWYAHEGS